MRCHLVYLLHSWIKPKLCPVTDLVSHVLVGVALIAPVSITLLFLIIEVLLKWNAALLGCVQPISSIYMTVHVVILQKSQE